MVGRVAAGPIRAGPFRRTAAYIATPSAGKDLTLSPPGAAGGGRRSRPDQGDLAGRPLRRNRLARERGRHPAPRQHHVGLGNGWGWVTGTSPAVASNTTAERSASPETGAPKPTGRPACAWSARVCSALAAPRPVRRPGPSPAVPRGDLGRVRAGAASPPTAPAPTMRPRLWAPAASHRAPRRRRQAAGSPRTGARGQGRPAQDRSLPHGCSSGRAGRGVSGQHLPDTEPQLIRASRTSGSVSVRRASAWASASTSSTAPAARSRPTGPPPPPSPGSARSRAPRPIGGTPGPQRVDEHLQRAGDPGVRRGGPRVRRRPRRPGPGRRRRPRARCPSRR